MLFGTCTKCGGETYTTNQEAPKGFMVVVCDACEQAEVVEMTEEIQFALYCELCEETELA